MKVIGALLMGLAVLIAVVPAFHNCQHDGKALALASGMTVPMRCFWTAMAAIATAVPLFGVSPALPGVAVERVLLLGVGDVRRRH